SHSASLLGRECTGISLMNCSTFPSLLTGSPFLPDHLRRPPSPTHSGRRLLGRVAFAALEVLRSRPTTGRASLATSLALIGPLTAVPPADSASPPEVTHCSSVPCHPQTPW